MTTEVDFELVELLLRGIPEEELLFYYEYSEEEIMEIHWQNNFKRFVSGNGRMAIPASRMGRWRRFLNPCRVWR